VCIPICITISKILLQAKVHTDAVPVTTTAAAAAVPVTTTAAAAAVPVTATAAATAAAVPDTTTAAAVPDTTTAAAAATVPDEDEDGGDDAGDKDESEEDEEEEDEEDSGCDIAEEKSAFKGRLTQLKLTPKSKELSHDFLGFLKKAKTTLHKILKQKVCTSYYILHSNIIYCGFQIVLNSTIYNIVVYIRLRISNSFKFNNI
jgi:hypothetical protein